MAAKHLGVIGDPISHSKSPAIHNAAYRALKVDWDYVATRVERGNLESWLETLDEDWLGVSVTAPLKEEAASYAATDFEKLLGSANTLVRSESGWLGYNTDVYGITQALTEAKLVKIDSVAIIGAGATARSALAAVAKLYPETAVTIAARRSEASARLANFANHALKLQCKTTTKIAKALAANDLVISTLPAEALDAAVKKLSKSWFAKPKGALFDVAYEPWPSRAAQLWTTAGLPVISGIEMLLWQAIAQIRIFNGGEMTTELSNEAAIIHAMRDSVGLI